MSCFLFCFDYLMPRWLMTISTYRKIIAEFELMIAQMMGKKRKNK